MMKKHGIWLIVCALACACGGRGKGQDDSSSDQPGESPDNAHGDGEKGDSSGSSPGSLAFLSSLASKGLTEPGPYDEPRQAADHDESKPHVAVIELAGAIVELSSFSWMSGSSGVPLRALTERLDTLAGDATVSGLLVRASDVVMSVAVAEELRRAFERFKGDGVRKLYCHAEEVSNFTYYVLSACDSIGVTPAGQIFITGVAAVPIHIKKLLDKLDVRAEFLHVGAYKGAAEPLTRDRPSPEMTETLSAILDRAYQTLVAGIARGRGLDPAAVRALIDQGVFSAEQAVAAKLADRAELFTAYRDHVLAGASWRTVTLDAAPQPDMSTLLRFLGMMPRERPDEPHIALLYAVGNVVDGRGGGLLGARQEIASRTMIAALRTVAEDDRVKAIVLRIDSGGGSALASELIFQAIREARTKKPVIVSLAGVAASGGYYIACAGDRVFAEENTLTGSIGVVGGKLALRDALASFGIGLFPMQRGKHALTDSPYAPWTAEDRAVVQALMDRVYRTFVARVAETRQRSPEDIDKIARGRVWTGADARERGLVDEIGGLHEALAEARRRGQLDDDAVIEVYPPSPTLADFIGSFGQVTTPHGVAGRLADALTEFGQILGPYEMRAAADLFATLALFRDATVLTAALFPVIVH